jgi:hypothetical protein
MGDKPSSVIVVLCQPGGHLHFHERGGSVAVDSHL